MRKSEAISFLNLKYKKIDDSKGNLFIPLGKRLVTYSYPELEKISQIEYTDDILDFHIFKENDKDSKIILIAKSNKTITLYKENGEKENEL